MRSKWVVLIGLWAGLAWGGFELGEWNRAMPAPEAMAAAKSWALTNNRPLVVMAGSSKTCHWCQVADASVFAKTEWKNYARAKGIPQFYADESFVESRTIRRALGAEYHIGLWPTILIFRIKEGADLNTADLDAARNAELIGMFLYRHSATYTLNGVKLKIPTPTPASFRSILESFYPDAYRTEWLKDLAGSLTVTLGPAAVLTAPDGPRWSVDTGATWYPSGTAVPLNPGSYTVSFRAVDGWNTPASQAVALVSGQAATASASYTRVTAATLTVTLTPPAAVAGGAKWSVDGGATWHDSGVPCVLEAGAYTVSFKDIPNWLSPASIAKTVAANATETAEAEYVEAGSLTVTLAPPRAVAAGARWGIARTVGETPVWYASGATAKLPTMVGGLRYVVTYASADGWVTPSSPVPVTIGAGTNAPITATYDPHWGTVHNPWWNGWSGSVWRTGWTMDYAGALLSGKPILLLFAGMLWDSDSQSTAASVFASAAWRNSPVVQGLALVMVDNPAYGNPITSVGTGPTLLRDAAYLEACGGTGLGEGKLRENLDLQQARLLPGQDRISYPTLLYLRPAVGGADPQVVGRIACAADPSLVLAQVEQLGALAADVGEERNNCAAWTPTLLEAPAALDTPVTAMASIGGVDPVDWGRFTPAVNTGWLFSIRGATAAPGATVSFAIYDATGTTVLLSGTPGAFRDGIAVDFAMPKSSAGKAELPSFLYRVETAGQGTVVPYTIEYEAVAADWTGEGILTAVITPPAAVAAGALWSENNGTTWRAPGATVRLAEGAYPVSFKPIDGWLTPASQTIDVVAGETATATGDYTQITTGTVAVTITPPAAVAAGAHWSTDGGATWHASAAVVSLACGACTISFSPLAGWTPPVAQELAVTAGHTTSATGAYVQITTGTLTVAITPAGAVAAGAQWSADGGTSWHAAASSVTLEAGPHTVLFQPVPGWSTPANQSVTVVATQSREATGAYTLQPTGTLTVTLTPAAALDAGAQWSVDDGRTWQASAAVVALPAGTHEVRFASLAAWLAPIRKSVLITVGAPTQAEAAYIPAVNGVWNPDLAAAKAQALRNNRPLVVMAGSSKTCHWCQVADASVFAKAEWQNYARTKGIPQFYADESFAESRTIRRALGAEYHIGLWPTILIFRIKEGADLTTTDLDTARNAELIGMFLYRSSATYTLNGVKLKIPSPTPASFRSLLESFYPAAYRSEWLKDLAGSLTVTLGPAAAVAAGAQWRVDASATWRVSGTTVALAPGSYTVSFSGVSGWSTPAPQSVSLMSSQTASAGATYTPLAAGTLAVTVTPAEAAAAGAQWSADGGATWYASGTSVAVGAGLHTVSFRGAPGWAPPADQVVSVAVDATTPVTGVYTVATTGTLSVTITPPGAVTAGAQWTADGGATWHASGASAILNAGAHTVSFSAITDWTKPADRSAVVTTGGTTGITGVYLGPPNFVDAPLYARTLSTGAQADLRLAILNGLGGTLSVRRVSGSLPPGLSQTLPAGTSAVVLSGKPTTAGTYTCVLEARTTVGLSLTVGGLITVNLTVKPVAEINPAGVGSFVGTVLEAGHPDVRGTITFTASATGKLLLKLALRTKTYSYSLANWSEVSQDGTLTAGFPNTGAGQALALSVPLSGRGVGTFVASEGSFALEFARVLWQRTDNPATAYVGYYTAPLLVADGGAKDVPTHRGAGYLVFSVAADGKTTYSGKLADGTRFSASTVLVETAAGTGLFTVFVPLYSKGGYLAGRILVVPPEFQDGPAYVSAYSPTPDDPDPFFEWLYPGKTPAQGLIADAFTVALLPSGTLFPPGTTLDNELFGLTEVVLQTLGTADLPDASAYPYTVGGATRYAAGAAIPRELFLATTAGRLTAPAATVPTRQANGTYVYHSTAGSNDSGLKVSSYSAKTGVFSGSFTLYYDYQATPATAWQHKPLTVKFEGVLSPICCTDDAPPLGQGFFVVPDDSAVPGYSIKRSYPVWVDRPPLE